MVLILISHARRVHGLHLLGVKRKPVQSTVIRHGAFIYCSALLSGVEVGFGKSALERFGCPRHGVFCFDLCHFPLSSVFVPLWSELWRFGGYHFLVFCVLVGCHGLLFFWRRVLWKLTLTLLDIGRPGLLFVGEANRGSKRIFDLDSL